MSIHGRSVIAALTLASGLAASASAQSTLVYSENFETRTQYPEWNSPILTNATGTVFTKFLGRYLGEEPTLSVTLPSPPLRDTSGGGDGGAGGGGGGGAAALPYLLTFDFYCIDSWDGSEPTFGIDRFHVLLNTTQTLLNETFANQHTFQSYTGSPAIGRSQLGFGESNDSVYQISIPFNASPGLNRLTFGESGLQSLADESWGIDNVRVYVNPVPAPGPAALLGLSGLVALRRRRPAASSVQPAAAA